MLVEYEVDNGGHKFKFNTTWIVEYDDHIAEETANDYFNNHDGWEDSWPIRIELFIESKSIGVYSVELEHQPIFSACKQ